MLVAPAKEAIALAAIAAGKHVLVDKPFIDRASAERMVKSAAAKGVEFMGPPAERFYGIEALMKDNSGNWFSMTQPKEGFHT